MANFVPLLPAKIAELALWQNTSENKTGKHILPPFFSADEKENEDASSAGTSGGDNSSTGMTESWIKLPDETDDPRWDKHGFRRDAARLSREEAFESNYAARLEAQEARWGRRASGAMGDEMPERAELKKLARTGIPTARRRAVWPHLCRAAELRAAHPPDYIETLLAQPAPLGPSEAGFAAERQVDLDLLRTFPGHRLLSSADGAAKLRNVLIAYARRNPMVGYVQGMGFVAALLLIFIDDAHEAFWCLCAVVETLLPVDFYSATLLGLRVEQAVFAELLQWKMPKLAAHLTHHAVVPELFATRWFVALFANALPVETTLRVWDAFLLEGSKVLHRVGLALLRVAEPRLLACRDQQELLCAIQEEQGACRAPPPNVCCRGPPPNARCRDPPVSILHGVRA